MGELPIEIVLSECSVAVSEISELTRSTVEKPLHSLLSTLKPLGYLLRLVYDCEEVLVLFPIAVSTMQSLANASLIIAHEWVIAR